MGKFKVGDKVRVTEEHRKGQVGVVVEADRYGQYDYRVSFGLDTCLHDYGDLELVESAPKFKVGDWVEVHGRGDSYDGTVGTVQKTSWVYETMGYLYLTHKDDKVGGENVLKFFEWQLQATKAPKPAPKFAKGGLIPKHFGKLYSYADFDAKLTAEVLGNWEEPKPEAVEHPSLKIYLAGPMSGIEHYNLPAFFSAARKLRKAGHTVFNPAENDIATGFNALGMEGHEAADHGFSLRDALKADLSWICENADALVLLDGWGDSKGVRAEMALADALGLPQYKMSNLPVEVTK